MPLQQVVDVVEEEPPKEEEFPEVQIRGDEAVIRVNGPQGTEERTVKLPRTTWG